MKAPDHLTLWGLGFPGPPFILLTISFATEYVTPARHRPGPFERPLSPNLCHTQEGDHSHLLCKDEEHAEDIPCSGLSS